MAFDETPTYSGPFAAEDVGTVNLMNFLTLQRGVYASRPAQGNLGAAYISTDGPGGTGGSEYLYFDNGSTWVGLGFLAGAGRIRVGDTTAPDPNGATITLVPKSPASFGNNQVGLHIVPTGLTFGNATSVHTVFVGQVTYNSSTGARTIGEAASVVVKGAPIAGTNISITNPYALWVDDGKARFDGTVIDRNSREILAPVIVHKTSGETVNNSATPQNDDDLVLPVEANAIYVARYNLLVLGGAGSDGADFSFDFSVPSGALYVGTVLGPALGVTDEEDTNMIISAFSNGGGYTGTLAGQSLRVTIDVRFEISSTPGNVVLQWAQLSAVAADTSVVDGSHLIAWKKGD